MSSSPLESCAGRCLGFCCSCAGCDLVLFCLPFEGDTGHGSEWCGSPLRECHGELERSEEAPQVDFFVSGRHSWSDSCSDDRWVERAAGDYDRWGPSSYSELGWLLRGLRESGPVQASGSGNKEPVLLRVGASFLGVWGGPSDEVRCHMEGRCSGDKAPRWPGRGCESRSESTAFQGVPGCSAWGLLWLLGPGFGDRGVHSRGACLWDPWVTRRRSICCSPWRGLPWYRGPSRPERW